MEQARDSGKISGRAYERRWWLFVVFRKLDIRSCMLGVCLTDLCIELTAPSFLAVV